MSSSTRSADPAGSATSRCATPSTMAVLPTPGSPTRTGLLVRRLPRMSRPPRSRGRGRPAGRGGPRPARRGCGRATRARGRRRGRGRGWRGRGGGLRGPLLRGCGRRRRARALPRQFLRHPGWRPASPRQFPGTPDRARRWRGNVSGTPDGARRCRGNFSGTPDAARRCRGNFTGTPNGARRCRGNFTGTPRSSSCTRPRPHARQNLVVPQRPRPRPGHDRRLGGDAAHRLHSLGPAPARVPGEHRIPQRRHRQPRPQQQIVGEGSPLATEGDERVDEIRRRAHPGANLASAGDGLVRQLRRLVRRSGEDRRDLAIPHAPLAQQLPRGAGRDEERQQQMRRRQGLADRSGDVLGLDEDLLESRGCRAW